MRGRMLQLAAACLIFVAAAPAPQRPPHARGAPQKKSRPAEQQVGLPCGEVFAFQVLLDRHGFSPGQIDGKPGSNFTHAIAALQAARKLQPAGEPDCDVWHALGGDKAGDLLTAYTITDEDMKGPFTEHIPRSLVEQASLPALSYRSPLEQLAERFHVSPALLQRLNAGAPLKAGATIKVPAVQPFDASAKPSPDAALTDATVVVSKRDSALRVTRGEGSIVFFAPVTTGSAHDPLPTGDWKVTKVLWHPPFHYNPKLFWDAKPDDTAATIKPGPNNPVGIVWIDLDLEHYGLHGTPEPGNVGLTESHGCVRLTNWDAAHVAALVKPGTPVLFR